MEKVSAEVQGETAHRVSLVLPEGMPQLRLNYAST